MSICSKFCLFSPKGSLIKIIPLIEDPGEGVHGGPFGPSDVYILVQQNTEDVTSSYGLSGADILTILLSHLAFDDG